MTFHSRRISYSNDFSGFSLTSRLDEYDLEEYMDEVVYNVFGDEFKGVRERNELNTWTVEEVGRWIGTLQFLGTRRDLIASRVRDECITGQVMRELTQQQWISRISLDFREYKLIDLILTGWKLGDTRITLSDLHSANNYNIHHNNSSNNQNNSHERLPLGVKAGLVADLSQCSPELAAQLQDSDGMGVADSDQLMETGVDSLGATELAVTLSSELGLRLLPTLVTLKGVRDGKGDLIVDFLKQLRAMNVPGESLQTCLHGSGLVKGSAMGKGDLIVDMLKQLVAMRVPGESLQTCLTGAPN